MNFQTQLVYANGEPIREGDWIRVFVQRLQVWHHGIVRNVAFLSPGFLGVYVVHNMKATGITTTELFEFADGQPVFLHRRPSPAQVAGICARVDASIGQRYHLFNQNCEHFASFAFSGKAESTSIKTAGALVLVGVVVGLLNS